MKANIAIAVGTLTVVLGVGCATSHKQHAEGHRHGLNCGHKALVHEGHTDYLHDGHLHSAHGEHSDEHKLAISGANPKNCTPDHACATHEKDHRHSANCGHERVPHGDHTDYLVVDHIHHSHDGHCDDHGKVAMAR